MTVVIVSQSDIVSHALEMPALSVFGPVLKVTKLQDIEVLNADTRAILYDLTEIETDVAALANFELKFAEFLEKVVILTRTNLDLHDVMNLIGRVGAIVPHSVGADDIIMIAQAMRPGIFVAPTEMLHALISANSKHSSLTSNGDLQLTERQMAVLAMLAEGQSNKAIARTLGVSETTVRVHVRAVLRKLGVKNRTQAALVADRYLPV